MPLAVARPVVVSTHVSQLLRLTVQTVPPPAATDCGGVVPAPTMAVVAPVAASWRRSWPAPRQATQTFGPSSVTAYCGRKSRSPPQVANASAVGRTDVTGGAAATRTERSLKRAPFTFASALQVPGKGSATRPRYEPRLPAGAVVTVRAV